MAKSRIKFVLILHPCSHLTPNILTIQHAFASIDAADYTCFSGFEEERNAQSAHPIGGDWIPATDTDTVHSGNEAAPTTKYSGINFGKRRRWISFISNLTHLTWDMRSPILTTIDPGT